MLFALLCTDKAGAADIRAANRATHLEYLAAHEDRIVVAGPLLSDDGAGMVGSLLILDFADKAEAETFAANDPYAKAGLFERVDIRPWRKVYPKG